MIKIISGYEKQDRNSDIALKYLEWYNKKYARKFYKMFFRKAWKDNLQILHAGNGYYILYTNF